MRTNLKRAAIAVLDDYQAVALQFADWSEVQAKADLTVFTDHLAETSLLAERLLPFDVLCVMRERTPMTRELLSQLPNLRLIVSTGRRNASIDLDAAKELNITIAHTDYYGEGAPELTWALLMAIARGIVPEQAAVRTGGWMQGVGVDLKGKTIGIIGLGNIGSTIAKYAAAFGMHVIAWSEHLTADKAQLQGAKLVTKEQVFREADFVTLHLVLSDRSRNTVTEKELDLMKPGAFLINTSRGPLVNEADLINALKAGTMAGAALDVFDEEPLATDHPYRTLPNVLATPHIGYVTERTYRLFFARLVWCLLPSDAPEDWCHRPRIQNSTWDSLLR